ncbi:MAG: hypothetical protein GY944_13515 [bacterium]|nr:hypothetical protein [bacterium]
MKRLPHSLPRLMLLLLLVLPVVLPCGFAAQARAQGGDGSAERDDLQVPGSGSRMGLSQGVDRLLSEVYKRQKELAEAEREVTRREAAVLELEVMIEERITSLEVDREEIETRIAEWEAQDGDRIKKLSKVYAALPPIKAARLLSDLELDLAVSVLSGMKQKNSAQVLAVIAPDRALVMSRRMVRPLTASPDGKAGRKK